MNYSEIRKGQYKISYDFSTTTQEVGELIVKVYRDLCFRSIFIVMSGKVLAHSLAFLTLLVLSVDSNGLKCWRCELEKCLEPAGCKFGIAKDICHCCNVCAKGLGSDCGGIWSYAGRCGDGLRCEPNPQYSQLAGKCVKN